MTHSHVPASEFHAQGRHDLAFIRVDEARQVQAVAHLVDKGQNGLEEHVAGFLEYVRINKIPLDGLWMAEATGKGISAAVLVVPNPGRTAMVFASRPNLSGHIDATAELIRHACLVAGEEGTCLAQALLDPSEKLEIRTFERAGFSKLSLLYYLERKIPRRGEIEFAQLPDDVTIRGFSAVERSAVCELLEQTYVETLDCPGLRGLRSTEDVLVGYQATGQFDPSLWWILCIDAEPSGVLFFCPSPTHASIELVYLGMAQHARGRGLGRLLLRHGLTHLAGRTEKTINLAVDSNNAPAIALYRDHGMREVLRRHAMILPVRRVQNTTAGN